MEEMVRAAFEIDSPFLYVFGAIFVIGCIRSLVSDFIPRTACYESQRRYDYAEKHSRGVAPEEERKMLYRPHRVYSELDPEVEKEFMWIFIGVGVLVLWAIALLAFPSLR